jgi:hypothetical protein
VGLAEKADRYALRRLLTDGDVQVDVPGHLVVLGRLGTMTSVSRD